MRCACGGSRFMRRARFATPAGKKVQKGREASLFQYLVMSSNCHPGHIKPLHGWRSTGTDLATARENIGCRGRVGDQIPIAQYEPGNANARSSTRAPWFFADRGVVMRPLGFADAGVPKR